MLHFYYVGHFDLANPVLPASNKRMLPEIKVLNPILASSVNHLLDSYGEIAEFIHYDKSGFAICHWSSANSFAQGLVKKFAIALASQENAIVMIEAPTFMVVYPDSAIATQERIWRERDASVKVV